MVIEQQITGAIIAGIKELYGAEVPAAQIQLQKTKKEFKGHLTLVVFLSSVHRRNLRNRPHRKSANICRKTNRPYLSSM